MNDDSDRVYNEVNLYTKYKLVEMLTEKYKDSKLDNLNAMEQLSDDILKVLAICGLKYYNKLRGKFDERS